MGTSKLTLMCLAVPMLLMWNRSACQEQPQGLAAAWWNVENLFDTRDDTLTLDDGFTPQGDHHWTPRRLNAKLQAIAKTIVMMDCPDVVGLAEVENAYVLRRLCMGTPLRMAGYGFIHHDSPDRRGIDCALLYRKGRFRPIADSTVSLSDSAAGILTRDILVVVGLTAEADTVCLLLNHWPSKLGGEAADRLRMQTAQRLRTLMAELHRRHPAAAVVALGDMNSTPDEPAVATGMGFGTDSLNAEGILNLTARLPRDWGSHKYQGEWAYLDQAYLLAPATWRCTAMELIRLAHLLTDEQRLPGVKPRRTYLGPHYAGGVSDHLPLLMRLECRKAHLSD